MTYELQHWRDELERGVAELRSQNPRQLQLERAISAALEDVRHREPVKRALVGMATYAVIAVVLLIERQKLDD
jgi:hypothetical protein